MCQPVILILLCETCVHTQICGRVNSLNIELNVRIMPEVITGLELFIYDLCNGK
jgi:hypothetical protein